MNLHKLAQQVCDARAQFGGSHSFDANTLLMNEDTFEELQCKARGELQMKPSLNATGRCWFVGLPIIVADIEEPFRVAYVL